MKIGIIYNRDKSKRIVEQFIAELRHEHDVVFMQTKNLQEGIQKTQNMLDDNCKIIVAAGGDGTVMSVINGFMNHAIKEVFLTILPEGTANDFAHEMKIFNYHDTIAAIKKQQVKKIDVIKCTYVDEAQHEQQLYGNSSAGVGLLSRVFQIQDRAGFRMLKKITGDFAYTFGTLIKIATTKKYSVTMSVNGKSSTTNMDMLLIRKTKKNGAVSFVPFAKPDSGNLDSILFHSSTIMNRYMLAARILLSKNKMNDKKVEYFGDESSDIVDPKVMEVKSPTPIPVELNGEFIGFTPCKFEVIPAAVQMITL